MCLVRRTPERLPVLQPDLLQSLLKAFAGQLESRRPLASRCTRLQGLRSVPLETSQEHWA